MRGRATPIRLYLGLVCVALAAAIGFGCGAFYRSNQNSYLLHAVGPSQASLASDWLLETTDSFPVFSALARMTFTWWGEGGLIALTIGFSFLGFLALGALTFSLLHDHSERSSRAWLASGAVLIVAGSSIGVAVLVRTLPSDLFSELWTFTPVSGFGRQYLLSVPGLLQPSDAGVLLLGATAFVVAAVLGTRRWPWFAAAGLVLVTCALHASYLAPVCVALGAMFLADVGHGRGARRLPGYLGTAAVACLVVLFSNPTARSSSMLSAGALEYLAFERAPHHTLITEWSGVQTGACCLLVLSGALLSRRYFRSWWFANVMLVSLATSLLLALVVAVTRSATLACAFPWRISVVLVPVGCAIICVHLAVLALRTSPRVSPLLRGFVTLGAIALVVLGASKTIVTSPRHSPLVHELRARPPAGIGLVALAAEDVRLNAAVPIFVDWKSPPYLPDELTEWIRRIEIVKRIETDPKQACDVVEQESLGWAVFGVGAVPDCLSAWSAREVDGYTLVERSR